MSKVNEKPNGDIRSKRNVAIRHFPCSYCNKTFNEKAGRDHHMQLHSSARPFSCDLCSHTCKTKKYLAKHVQVVHKPPSKFQCDYCGKKFHYKCILDKHIVVHTNSKPYKCKECGKGFNSQYSLSGHALIHKSLKPYKCLYCEYACRDSSTLRKHHERHQGLVKTYDCLVCDKRFSKRTMLNQHVAEVHMELDLRTVPCERCDKKFKTKTMLNIHVETIHNRKYATTCEICGYKLTNKYNMSTHLLKHVDAKPYKCAFTGCTKRYKDPQTLKKHSLIHYPEKQLPCRICGKRFTRKERLRKHVKQHVTRIKNVQCDYCGVSFYNKNYLEVHIRKKHSAKKRKFICDMCDFEASAKPSLIGHIKGHYRKTNKTCHICHKTYKNDRWLQYHLRHAHSLAEDQGTQLLETDVKVEPSDTLPEFELFEIEKEEILGEFNCNNHNINEELSEEQIVDNSQERVDGNIVEEIDTAKNMPKEYGVQNIFGNDIEENDAYSMKISSETITTGQYIEPNGKKNVDLSRKKRNTQDLEGLKCTVKEAGRNVRTKTVSSNKIQVTEDLKNVLTTLLFRDAELTQMELTNDGRSDEIQQTECDINKTNVRTKRKSIGKTIGQQKIVLDKDNNKGIENDIAANCEANSECSEAILAEDNQLDSESFEHLPTKDDNIKGDKNNLRRSKRFLKGNNSSQVEADNNYIIPERDEMDRQSSDPINPKKVTSFVELQDFNPNVKCSNSKSTENSTVHKKKSSSKENGKKLSVRPLCKRRKNSYNDHAYEVDKQSQQYAKKFLDKLLKKTRDRNEVKMLEKTRQEYNDRILKAKGSRTEKLAIKYFDNNTDKTTEYGAESNNNDGETISTVDVEKNASIATDMLERADDNDKNGEIHIDGVNNRYRNISGILNNPNSPTKDGGIDNENEEGEKSTFYEELDDVYERNATNLSVSNDSEGKKETDRIRLRSTSGVSKRNQDDDRVDDASRSDAGDNNGKLKLNTHQCYVCFKLFDTKDKLVDHCSIHFDTSNSAILKKCPLCKYSTTLNIIRHMRLVHKIKMTIPKPKITNRRTVDNGFRHCYKVNSSTIDNIDVVPGVQHFNKQAYMEIDKRSRKLKDTGIAKTKLVKKGGEWVVERETTQLDNVDDFILPHFDAKEILAIDLEAADYLGRMKKLYRLAKIHKRKMLFPCESCDKICQTVSALKLHNRKHDADSKPFKKKVWKHKIGVADKMTNRNERKMNWRVEEIDKKIDKKTELSNRRKNRYKDPKPIVAKHKCDPELIKFFEKNVKGGDVEFWQFLKIFNKMSRDNVNDFDDLAKRPEFGLQSAEPNVNKTVDSNDKISPNVTNTVSDTHTVMDATRKRRKNANNFKRIIRISKRDHQRRNFLKEKLRQKIASEKNITS